MMATPMVNPTPYIQAVAPWLPANYPLKLQSLCQSSEDVLILEVVLRFLCGGECPPDAAPRVRQEWSEKQRAVMLSIQALRGSAAPRADPKRKWEHEPNGVDDASPKRSRLPNGHHHAPLPHPHQLPHPSHAPSASPPPPGTAIPPALRREASPRHLKVSPESPTPHSAPAIAQDGHPLFTIHNVSVTSPVRKKVDITVGQSSIQMLNPTTSAIEATLPVAIFVRAFILPTRGKSKPHWTVVLAASDEPGKPQIVFGVEAMSPLGYKTTEYSYGPPLKSQTHHPRNTPTIPSLRAFLRYVPAAAPVLEPTTAVFRSAVQPSALNATSTQPSPDRPEGVPGIEAYRGSKQGTLWFFREGILWGESKPCEFWAVEDLAGGGEAVRLLSATGRTCSIFLKRAPKAGRGGEDDVEMDQEGTETEFSMIDGREQEPVSAWVRAHRHLFGQGQAKANGRDKHPNGTSSPRQNGDAHSMPNGKHEKGYWGKVTLNNLPDGSDDEDDESYKQSGSEDGSATSSSSSSSGNSNGTRGTASQRSASAEHSNAGSAKEEEDDDDDEMMDPARHPLMHPGAMPKRITREAVEMAVGMVNGTAAAERDPARARGVPPPPPYGLMHANGRAASPGGAQHHSNGVSGSFPARTNGVHHGGASALVSTDPGGAAKVTHNKARRIAQTNGRHSREVESEDDEVDELDD
jgi:hypothetical protein